MGERIKISFIDMEKKVTLGQSTVSMSAIRKLSLGDKIEFKDEGAVFGMYEIKSFAVNEGYPEGHINLMPVKPKGKVKLQEINEDYLDSIIPF